MFRNDQSGLDGDTERLLLMTQWSVVARKVKKVVLEKAMAAKIALLLALCARANMAVTVFKFKRNLDSTSAGISALPCGHLKRL